jgi:hypothetical protein
MNTWNRWMKIYLNQLSDLNVLHFFPQMGVVKFTDSDRHPQPTIHTSCQIIRKTAVRHITCFDSIGPYETKLPLSQCECSVKIFFLNRQGAKSSFRKCITSVTYFREVLDVNISILRYFITGIM